MTKEIIEAITETTFKHKSTWCNYEGFVIRTNLQEIKVGIDNSQGCCENWGYLTSEDTNNFDSFIGTELLEVKLTDTSLNTTIADELKSKDGGDIFCTMFVTFETSNGTFQIVAYNDHNGYYGHDAVLVSNSEDYSIIL